MKVAASKQQTPPAFTPVHVTFTLESQEELNALYRLFNTAVVCSVLEGAGLSHQFDDGAPYQVLESVGAQRYPGRSNLYDELKAAFS